MFRHNMRLSVPNMSALSAPRCLGWLSDKLAGSRVNLVLRNENKFVHVGISMHSVFGIFVDFHHRCRSFEDGWASDLAIVARNRNVRLPVKDRYLLGNFISSTANLCAIKVSPIPKQVKRIAQYTYYVLYFFEYHRPIDKNIFQLGNAGSFIRVFNKL